MEGGGVERVLLLVVVRVRWKRVLGMESGFVADEGVVAASLVVG